MTNKDANSKLALGFLTVLDDPQLGLLGGYLVLNMAGRPLEFHCTAPVKPNRAQQILYGPTLVPYLYGEQIGQALVGKSKLAPTAICTDREPALAVREFVDTPVALVLPPESGAETPSAVAEKVWRVDGPHAGLSTFSLGRNRLAVPAKAAADRDQITQRLAELSESFDLAEPFQRIREAIEEARRGG